MLQLYAGFGQLSVYSKYTYKFQTIQKILISTTKHLKSANLAKLKSMPVQNLEQRACWEIQNNFKWAQPQNNLSRNQMC